MEDTIRIGTRDSQLALWQATEVEKKLNQHGYKTTLVPVKSEGDLDLSTPLYEMGVEGVFTRYLDAALLTNKVDIAVHSMKDVPTILAKGLTQAAVLKRGQTLDLLLYKNSENFLEDFSSSCTIATGSIRRKAQWLHRYPNSIMTGLRGNVNTRLRKLRKNQWDGALFAAAGLERINLRPEKAIELKWMLPAPAQGAILVVCRTEDESIKKACSILDDAQTALCTKIERDFLKTLHGGCATPISALAQIEGENISLQGNVLTTDGKQKIAIEKNLPLEIAADLGLIAGNEILKNGAEDILNQLNK